MDNPFEQELQTRGAGGAAASNPFTQELDTRTVAPNPFEKELAARSGPTLEVPSEKKYYRYGKYGQKIERQPTREERLQEMGLPTNAEGGDWKARIARAAGSPEDVKTQLKQQFGQDVQTSDVPDVGMVFKNPKTNEWEPLNKPGFDIGDLASLAVEAPTVIAELVGGVLGARGGPSGAAGGAAVAGGATKAAILSLLKKAGIIDPSTGQIVKEAGTEALLAGVGGEIPSGARAAKLLFSPETRAARELAKAGITPEKMEAARKALEPLAKETGAEFTAGQQMATVEPELGARMRATEQRATTPGAIEAEQQKMVSQRQARERAVAEAAPTGPVEPETVGLGITGTAKAQGETGLRTIEETTDEAVKGMEKKLSSMAGLDAPEAGAKFREAVQEGRDKIFSRLSDEYDKLWAQAPEDTKVDMAGLREVSKEWKDKLGEDIFQSMAPEDRAVVQDALKAGIKEREGLVVNAQGVLEQKTIREDVGSSLAATSRALSLLKSQMRILEKRPELAPVKQRRLLQDFTTELQAAREDALNSLDPELAAKIRAQDEAWKKAKTKIDEAMVGDILKKKGQERYSVDTDKVIQHALSSNTALDEYLGLAASYPELNAVDDLKQAVLGKYQKEVVEGSTKHQTWMHRNEGVVDRLFSPEQRQMFNTAERAQQEIGRLERLRNERIKDLKSTFDYKLGHFDPYKAVAVAEGSVDKTRAMKRIIGGDNDLWRAYQDVRRQNLVNSVVNAKGETNLAKLDGLLKPGSETRHELVISLGGDYVSNLEKLRDLMKVEAVATGRPLERQVGEAAGNPVVAARKAALGPLTHTGFIARILGSFFRAKTNEAIENLLTNPKLLEKLLKSEQSGADARTRASILTALGLPLALGENK